jgi:hypothetical protein
LDSGRGYGRNFGWYGPTYGAPYAVNPQDDAGMLKDQAKYIKQELDAINKRIEELESQSQQS